MDYRGTTSVLQRVTTYYTRTTAYDKRTTQVLQTHGVGMSTAYRWAAASSRGTTTHYTRTTNVRQGKLQTPGVGISTA